jgi:hypothetical protein
MLLGKTLEQRCKEQDLKNSKVLDLSVPHKVFAWRPVKIETGQKVWLSSVWRIGIFRDWGYFPTEFQYFTNYQSAYERSSHWNTGCGAPHGEAISKRLFTKYNSGARPNK